MRNIRTLVKMELCNLYGINVFRYTKDSGEKKKSIALAATIAVVLVVLMSYVGGLSSGLITVGLKDIVPAYMAMMASLLTLFLSIFKTGATIFRKKGYDFLSALPLSNYAVVISRFIRLYVESLGLTLVVMIPGLLVYGVLTKAGMLSVLLYVIGALLIPLLPVAVASFIGALITGISSRMKHQSRVEIVLTILLMIGLFAGSGFLAENEENFTTEILTQMAEKIADIFDKVYPPAMLFGNAVVQGDVSDMLVFAGISVAVFAVTILVVSWNFHGICRSLFGTSATHDYKLEHLQMHSVRKALLEREMKRYFSSSVYVTNTIVGPIMGTAFCIGLFFIDFDSIVVSLPGTVDLKGAVPFVIAAIFSMMNPSVVSVSMEGKEWWIVKSLPLRAKDILDSKLLFGLCVAAPFLVIAELIAIFVLGPGVLELLWLIVIPVLCLLLTCVFGISVNLKLPKMNWENEVSVVKQSAAAMIGGIVVVLVIILCAIPVLLVPAQYKDLVCLAICILLVALTVRLYYKNNRVDLKKI